MQRRGDLIESKEKKLSTRTSLRSDRCSALVLRVRHRKRTALVTIAAKCDAGMRSATCCRVPPSQSIWVRAYVPILDWRAQSGMVPLKPDQYGYNHSGFDWRWWLAEWSTVEDHLELTIAKLH
jgi:hypothetical protein